MAGGAWRAARDNGLPVPPEHILIAPTTLLKAEGCAAGHACDHDAAEGISGQDHCPEGMARETFHDRSERSG